MGLDDAGAFILNRRDQAAIDAVIALAAIELTPVSGSTFTREQLMAGAQELAGDDLDIVDADIDRAARSVLATNGALFHLR